MALERPWRRATAVAVALLVLGLVAACGGGGDEDDDSAGPASTTATTFGGDPDRVCNLVTKADVEAAIGAPVGEGQGASGAACRYDLVGASNEAVLVLLTNDPKNRETFERTRTQVPGAESLPGLGDQAYTRVGDQGVQAFVLKGDNIAVVVVNLERPDAALKEAAQKLAQVAASRV